MSTDPTLRNTSPCPICGKCDYEWGYAKGSHPLRYVSGEINWIKQAFYVGEQLTARSCRECGHVALFQKLPQ